MPNPISYFRSPIFPQPSPIVLSSLIALLFSSCSSSLIIPRPNSGTPSPVPPMEVSVVQVPVSMSLGSMFRDVEKAVPGAQRASKDWTVVGENALGDIGVKYEIWRDPLQLGVQDSRLRVTGRAHYWFQFAQSVPKPIIGGNFWQALGSCGVGEPPRDAVVGLETRIGWTDAWGLTSTTSILPTTFPNKCEVTFLKFDVTGRVEQAFNAGLKQGAALADSKIRQLGNFRPMGETIWRQLQEPIALDSGVWLVIDPGAAFAGPFGGSGQTLSTSLGLTASPRIVFGPRPAPGGHPLPKLATAAAGNGFHVAVEGEISFADASRRLASALAGQSFTKVGHTVKIVAASVYGAGDWAVVQLELAGDVTGIIYLVGTPAYDPKRNVLYVRDLDYSLETGQTLANVADWLFHGGFRSSIAEHTEWPLDAPIADVKGRLEKALNRTIAPNVTASGTITGIRPVGVYLSRDAFKARVVIEGAVRVEAGGK